MFRFNFVNESKAFFYSCACHKWNLLLRDMAKLLTLQFLYLVSLSKVTCSQHQCWDGLFSEITWHKFIISLDWHDIILEIIDKANDPLTHGEIESLAQHLKDHRFIVVTVFWHDILHHINTVNYVLQNADRYLPCIQADGENLSVAGELQENQL